MAETWKDPGRNRVFSNESVLLPNKVDLNGKAENTVLAVVEVDEHECFFKNDTVPVSFTKVGFGEECSEVRAIFGKEGKYNDSQTSFLLSNFQVRPRPTPQ